MGGAVKVYFTNDSDLDVIRLAQVDWVSNRFAYATSDDGEEMKFPSRDGDECWHLSFQEAKDYLIGLAMAAEHRARRELQESTSQLNRLSRLKERP
jgi:hypothetical protein